MTLDTAAYSITGKRENNEDACVALHLGDRTVFLAVADGMGGFTGGEVASALVLESITSHLKTRCGDGPLDHASLRQIVEEIFPLSQARLRERKAAQPGLEGMGTTLSCVLASGDAFVVGNIGDSRVYLLRDGALRQITEDHTHVQELQKETGQRADESIVRTYGHFLTRSLDGGDESADVFPHGGGVFTFQPGDAILICSDGLIADKRDEGGEHWASILKTTPTLHEAARRLTKEALVGGSSDNITVVLATYGEMARQAARGIRLSRARVMMAVSVVAAGLLVYGGSVLLSRWGDAGMPAVPAAPPVTRQLPPGDPPAPPPVRKEVLPWSPFHESAPAVGYTLSELFSWGEYQPVDDVDRYEVSINEDKPVSVHANYIELRTVPGLKPGTHRVRIRAVLKNGSSAVASTTLRIHP